MIPFQDWNKGIIATKEIQEFLQDDIKEGDMFNPLCVFCLLLFSYSSVGDIDSKEGKIEHIVGDHPVDSPWYHASYSIVCYGEYVELSNWGRISVTSSDYLNPRKAFKFLELCNFNLP